MKLESDGILISLRPINERDSVAKIFTREYGMLCGAMRAAIIAKKNRPLVGQVGFASWNARLDSQLGTFHWESSENMAVALMLGANTLAFMNSVFDLLGVLLPEREQYATLYDSTIVALRKLGGQNMDAAYLEWEVGLLHDLGFALDFARCSGCGGMDNLHYLSPRTGRAVCDDCAAPYINRLYKLPINLDTTLGFVSGVCAQMGVDVPRARLFLSRLKKN